MKYVNRAFAAVALAGLIASAIVHLAAFAGVNLGFKIIFSLLMAVPVLVIPIALKNSAPDFRSAARVQAEFLTSFYGSIPKWAKTGILSLFFYFAVNFAIFLVMTGNGFPERMQDGSIAIINHGQFVRDSNSEEMRRAELMRQRFFSSCGAVFYFYAFAYYGLRSNQKTLING